MNYIIIATRHATKELKAEVQKLKAGLFAGRFKNITIKYELLQEPYNYGNVIRQMNERTDIWDDFIVMYSDIVCNANLNPALKMHYDIKAAEKADKNSDKRVIMTKVFTEVAFSNHVRD